MKLQAQALILPGAVCASRLASAPRIEPGTDGWRRADNTSRADTAVPIAGRVTRAQFTSEVRDLEPIDPLMALNNGKTQGAYVTEVRDSAGQTVSHRWEYNGKETAEIPFKVGAARWRVYATKTLHPSRIGE